MPVPPGYRRTRASKLDLASVSIKRSQFRSRLKSMMRSELEDMLQIATQNVLDLRAAAPSESDAVDTLNLISARERLFDVVRAYYLHQRPRENVRLKEH